MFWRYKPRRSFESGREKAKFDEEEGIGGEG
jgi:hypothetical protein